MIVIEAQLMNKSFFSGGINLGIKLFCVVFSDKLKEDLVVFCVGRSHSSIFETNNLTIEFLLLEKN